MLSSKYLLALPAMILMGSLSFLVVPTLLLAGFTRVSDNSLNYSINPSAKEALYTPTSQEAKYKAKAFIDMFVQRAAKVLALGINLALSVLVVVHVRWLSVVSAAVIVAWLPVLRYLGRRGPEYGTMRPSRKLKRRSPPGQRSRARHTMRTRSPGAAASRDLGTSVGIRRSPVHPRLQLPTRAQTHLRPSRYSIHPATAPAGRVTGPVIGMPSTVVVHQRPVNSTVPEPA